MKQLLLFLGDSSLEMFIHQCKATQLVWNLNLGGLVSKPANHSNCTILPLDLCSVLPPSLLCDMCYE